MRRIKMDMMTDLSGYMIYCLLLNKEAERLGIIFSIEEAKQLLEEKE